MSFTRVNDYFVSEHGRVLEKLPRILSLVEPRRIQTPHGYDSTQGIGPATYLMSQQYRLTQRPMGGPPLELAGVSIAYEMMNHKMPIYFVSESLARAAAGTELPSDFLLHELHWPMPALVLGFPAQFMREYADLDSSYVWCSKLEARGYPAPFPINGPIMEPTFPKVSLQYYRIDKGSREPEIFIGSFPLHEPVNDVVRRYAYTDYTKAENIDVLKERLHMVASLVFKVLLILAAREGLIQMGECVRPRSEKRGRVKDALWSPNFIGSNYRTMKQGSGNGTTVSTHWRRGHMTWQVMGSREDFVSVSAMPRDADGGIDWSKADGDLKAKFYRSHRRTWIDPVLVGNL